MSDVAFIAILLGSFLVIVGVLLWKLHAAKRRAEEADRRAEEIDFAEWSASKDCPFCCEDAWDWDRPAFPRGVELPR